MICVKRKNQNKSFLNISQQIIALISVSPKGFNSKHSLLIMPVSLSFEEFHEKIGKFFIFDLDVKFLFIVPYLNLVIGNHLLNEVVEAAWDGRAF